VVEAAFGDPAAISEATEAKPAPPPRRPRDGGPDRLGHRLVVERHEGADVHDADVPTLGGALLGGGQRGRTDGP